MIFFGSAGLFWGRRKTSNFSGTRRCRRLSRRTTNNKRLVLRARMVNITQDERAAAPITRREETFIARRFTRVAGKERGDDIMPHTILAA
jgi:hypothetical protein